MGNSEEPKSSKSEKASSPPVDQANVHVYHPDWAAMQAYYGPRVAMPQYFSSAVASGHAPHPYMWGPPQPMMPPYGAPYAAIYAHGGVYAHPGVTLAPTPTAETPTKSSGNTEQGLMKKLKGFDGLTMSIGNGNAESGEGGANHTESQSSETDGSSDESNGNTAGGHQHVKKRSREETPTTDGDGNTEMKKAQVPVGDETGTLGGNVAGTVSALELKNPSSTNVKTTPHVPQPCAITPSEDWSQNERELKRERRKQSNRESARRSRLRKQAETEELAKRVEILTAENVSLKSEIIRQTENSEKLKLENAALAEKLRNARPWQREDGILNEPVAKRAPVSTENFLSRVDNSGRVDRSDEGGEIYGKKSNSGTKLRQLLDANPRAANAVAAG